MKQTNNKMDTAMFKIRSLPVQKLLGWMVTTQLANVFWHNQCKLLPVFQMVSARGLTLILRKPSHPRASNY